MIIVTITVVVLMTSCQDIRGNWGYNRWVSDLEIRHSVTVYSSRAQWVLNRLWQMAALSGLNATTYTPTYCLIVGRPVMLCEQGDTGGASPAKWQCCDQTGLTCRIDQVICVKLSTAPWPKQRWCPLKIAFYQTTAFVCSVLRTYHDYFPKQH